MQRVIYQDPQSWTIYHYLTNLPAGIPPGLIALLYKVRWDIEPKIRSWKEDEGRKLIQVAVA